MRIRADSEDLSAEGSRIDAAADTADSNVEQAIRQVTDTLSASWSGGSATAFMAAFSRWQSAAEAGSTELHRLAAGLLETARDVRAVEDEHLRLLRVIESDLPVFTSQRSSPNEVIGGLTQLMGGR